MGMFLLQCFQHFLVGLGVVLGACMMTGIGSVLTLQPPADQMESMSEKIKIWAVVAAIGGTIEPIRSIESNFAAGDFSKIIQQLLFILFAFVGAQIGTLLIKWASNWGLHS